MKNLILQIILIILLFSLNAFCQNFSVTIVKVKDVTCHGGSTGELRADPVNISGGVSNFTYLWSNGRTTALIRALPVGTYSVTVTGRTLTGGTINRTATYTLNYNYDVIINYDKYESCPKLNNGEIHLNPTGGVPGYTYNWKHAGGNGATKIIPNLGVAAVQVTITDSRGCAAITTINIGKRNDVIDLNAIKTDISCHSEEDGKINLLVNYAGPYNLSYLWSNNKTTRNISDLKKGIYTVTVTDDSYLKCSATASTEIIEPSSLNIFWSVSGQKCFGVADGSIMINTTGGTPPYSINWSTGEMNVDKIENLAPNIQYSVTVTDNNHCSATFAAIFTAATEIVNTNSNVMDAYCFGSTNGAIFQEIEGGSPPYSFQWNKNSIDENLVNIKAGNYICTVTDFYNCKNIFKYTVGEPDKIIVTNDSIVHATAQSSGAIYVTVTGGNSPYQYLWIKDNEKQDTTEDIEKLAPGDYKLFIKDDNNCLDSSALITVNLLSKTQDNLIDKNKFILTEDQISITAFESLSDLNIGIFSINGQLQSNQFYKSVEIGQKLHIDIKQLSPAQYILQLKSKHKSQAIQFQKSN